MGYMTRFKVEIIPYGVNIPEVPSFLANLYDPNLIIKKRIGEVSGYGDVEDDDIKWYTWQEDMILVSKEYPDFLMVVDGSGEESGDVWKAYFLDGKMQYEKADIVLPDFDETKLQPLLKL